MKDISIKNGYTLVEILVSATIFVVIVGVGVATFSSASGFESKTRALREVNQASRFAMETIERDVRNANGTTIFYNNKRVSNISGNPKLIVYGVGFFSNGKLKNNYDAIGGSVSSSSLAVFKQTEGKCKNWVEVVEYYEETSVNTNSTKLKQLVYYKDPNDFSIDATDASCPGRSSATPLDVLPPKVEIVRGSLSFTGDYVRRVDNNTIYYNLTQQPYVTINMKIQSAGYASTSFGGERARVELKTTVVPRAAGGMKY